MKGFLGVDFNQIGKNKKNPLEKRREILRELDNARTPDDINRIGKEVRLGWASAKQEYREKFLDPNRSTTEDPSHIEQEIADWENMMRVVKEKSAPQRPTPGMASIPDRMMPQERTSVSYNMAPKDELSKPLTRFPVDLHRIGDKNIRIPSSVEKYCRKCNRPMTLIETDENGDRYWGCDC